MGTKYSSRGKKDRNEEKRKTGKGGMRGEKENGERWVEVC